MRVAFHTGLCHVVSYMGILHRSTRMSEATTRGSVISDTDRIKASVVERLSPNTDAPTTMRHTTLAPILIYKDGDEPAVAVSDGNCEYWGEEDRLTRMTGRTHEEGVKVRLSHKDLVPVLAFIERELVDELRVSPLPLALGTDALQSLDSPEVVDRLADLWVERYSHLVSSDPFERLIL